MTKIESSSERKHAKLSASGSAMWLACSASVKANSNIKRRSSMYADEGSCAHELADVCMKSETNAIDHIKELMKGTIYINENYGSVTSYFKSLKFIGIKVLTKKDQEAYFKDMCRHVQEYLDYIRSHETKTSETFCEQRVDFSDIVPEGFGTNDASVVVQEEKILHVFDLKFGKGEPVYAEENSQGMLYGYGQYRALDFMYDIDTIRIHICQPRINNWSYWDISVKDLKKWSKWVTERAQAALSDDAEFTPGEKQCRWCGFKDDCTALGEHVERCITAEFDDLEGRDPKTEFKLTDLQKKTILDNKDLIVDFLNAVEASVVERLISGERFEGYKMVRGRANRKWTDKAEAFLEKELGEEAYTKKLIGIGAAEKALGKDAISEITEKPEGKPTLAVMSDKRAPIVFEKIEDQFEDLEK